MEIWFSKEEAEMNKVYNNEVAIRMNPYAGNPRVRRATKDELEKWFGANIEKTKKLTKKFEDDSLTDFCRKIGKHGK